MIISNTEQDKFTHLKNTTKWGRLVAQPVKRPTLAQVTVSHFVSLNAVLDSVLKAQSLLGILSLSLSQK